MSQVTLVIEFSIEPGRADDFAAAAQAYVERSQGEPGTLRYDWHVSEDGRRGINIELFADAAAFLVHDRHVADLDGSLEGIAAATGFYVIGDVGPDVRARLDGRATDYVALLVGVAR